MADSTIIDLPRLEESPAVGDIVPIVDVSDTTDSAEGTNKGVTTANLVNATNVSSAGAVLKTGNETVAGVKTFTSFPVTPSSAPTTDYQVANKKFVDDSISGSGGYTDEQAQDAVGNAVGTGLDYDDASGAISVDVTELTISLDSLSDVVMGTPSTDQVLKYNGTEWTNGAETSSSASNGVDFFLDDTTIVATGTDNDFPIKTLSKTPVTSAEDVDSIAMTSNTVLYGMYYYNTALTGTQIDAGVWNLDLYAGVSSAVNVTSIQQNIMRARPGTGTLTITGTGTSRTATASTGTPFATDAIDASATNTNASYISTPKGLYQITARTSDTEVTITTPTGYTNESSVAYTVHKKLFAFNSPEINNVATAPAYAGLQLYTITSVQPAFTIIATDKLSTLIFGISDGSRTVYFAHNGTTRYTHFHTPLTTRHNDLAGLQGGTSGEYYHLTSAQLSGLWTNPMTTAGDVIYGGTSGAPTRLAKGTASQVLTMNTGATAPEWATPSAGGGQSPYDAVVAASGGDYTTVAAAVTAGKKVLRLKGTVTETADLSYDGALTSLIIYGLDPMTDIWDLAGYSFRVVATDGNNADCVELRNITIKDANYGTTGYDNSAIWVKYAKRVVISNCIFSSGTTRDLSAIGVHSCNLAVIENNNITGYQSGIYAISADGNSYTNRLTIQNNCLTGSATNSANYIGIYIKGENRNTATVTGNSIYSYGLGVKALKATVSSNMVYNSKYVGTGAGAIGDYGHFIDNTISNSAGLAIYTNNDETFIADNYISGGDGVRLDSARQICHHNDISGCTGEYGIYCTSNVLVSVISNNRIESCGNTIYIPSGCNDNIITYNMLDSNSTNTITDSGTGNDVTGNKSVA